MKIAIIGPNGNVADVFKANITVSNGCYFSLLMANSMLQLLIFAGGSCPTDLTNATKPYSQTYDYDCLPTLLSAVQNVNVNGTTTYHGGCSLSPSPSDGSGHPEGQPCDQLVNTSAVLAAGRRRMSYFWCLD